ncbi:hypothetical protein [Streptomyces sp. NPDC093260]|uniref:hypothetical protein n=1 Tax=Streptomyces sp. NPDC093260 TaxID=3155073 RepID=UPI003424A074
MSADVVIRAFRFALGVTAAQLADLDRHVGASRWAFSAAKADSRTGTDGLCPVPARGRHLRFPVGLQ